MKLLKDKIRNDDFPDNILSFFVFAVSSYKTKLVIILLTGIISAILTAFIPFIIKNIINDIENHEGLLSDLLHNSYKSIISYSLLFIAIAFNTRLKEYCLAKTTPEIKNHIWLESYKSLQKQSIDFFSSNHVGNLVSKISDLAHGFEHLLRDSLTFVIEYITIFFVALIIMATVNPVFSLIIGFWGVIFLAITSIFFKKSVILSQDASSSNNKIFASTNDSFSNIQTIKQFSLENNEEKMLKTFLNMSFIKNLELNNYVIKVRIWQDITIISMICAMLAFLIYYYAQKKITIGDFVFILILSNTIFKSIWFLVSKFLSIYETIGKCNQALISISTKPQIFDSCDKSELQIKGKINLNNVDFAYSIGNDRVFKKLSLEIKAGSKIGIVGLSGNGKSTLAKLLLKFYDIQNGEILIDDVAIDCFSQKNLRDNISYVPQDIMLFHRTIYENIFCGNIKSSYYEVIEASKMADCHDFIIALPDGYNSIVGERGVKLSVGQRQRIAIARAFLKKSPIVIFDEASSNLDSVTEKTIHNHLFNFISNSTAIIIAHRLSTISHLDRIVVFDQGEIIEDGTHEELLLLKGIYKKMWDKQTIL